jgi:hypothetical protein
MRNRLDPLTQIRPHSHTRPRPPSTMLVVAHCTRSLAPTPTCMSSPTMLIVAHCARSPAPTPTCMSPPTCLPLPARTLVLPAPHQPPVLGHARWFGPPISSTTAARVGLLHTGYQCRSWASPPTPTIACPLPQLWLVLPSLSLDFGQPLPELWSPVSSVVDTNHRQQARPPSHEPSITGEQSMWPLSPLPSTVPRLQPH